MQTRYRTALYYYCDKPLSSLYTQGLLLLLSIVDLYLYSVMELTEVTVIPCQLDISDVTAYRHRVVLRFPVFLPGYPNGC